MEDEAYGWKIIINSRANDICQTLTMPSRQCHQLAGLSSPFLLRRAGTAVALFSAYLPEGSVESRNRVESLTSRLYLFLSSISCSTSSLSYVFWHCVEIFVCSSKIYSYAFARIPPLL
jgi:hypothetical protein